MEDDNEWVAEITIPFPRLHKFVKAHEISPLTLLMAAICHAVYRTYYVGTDRKDAIVAEVPWTCAPTSSRPPYASSSPCWTCPSTMSISACPSSRRRRR